ncbi:hypothetical protein J6590_066857 [Homalodisca vitripennis]|nr:hypothetical protein J6590_066857 [Homalodisca vitripennis]
MSKNGKYWRWPEEDTGRKDEIFYLEQDLIKKIDPSAVLPVTTRGDYRIEDEFLNTSIIVEKEAEELLERNKNTLESHWKTDFNDQMHEVDLKRCRRLKVTFPAHLNQVSASPLPITKQKYNDLIALLPFIPSVCHDFYKNLKHSNAATNDYPQEDDDMEPL